MSEVKVGLQSRGRAFRSEAARRVRKAPVVVLLALVLSSVFAVGCLNDLTPQGRWSSPTSDGEHIYVGNSDGVLVRIDAETNRYDPDWVFPYQVSGASREPRGVGAIYGAPTIVDGVVYSAGYTCQGNVCEGAAFAVSPETGESAWLAGEYSIDTKIVGQLQSSGSGLLVFGTSAVDGDRDPPGYAYALNQDPSNTRRVAWRVPLDGEAWGDAAIIDSTAYIGTDAGTLYAIDVKDEEKYENDAEARVQWTYKTEGSIAGPILAYDGNIYFGDLSGNFYKIDPDAGSHQWIFDAGNWIWAKAAPDPETGAIYVGTLSGEVFSIDAESGAPIWSTEIEGQIVGSPLLFERRLTNFTQKLLAVPSGDEDVHIIHTPDGQKLGTLATGAAVKSSPALINGFIYVHTLDGDLMWFSPEDQTRQGCMALKDGGRCG